MANDWPPTPLTLIPEASENDPRWPLREANEVGPLVRVTDVNENRQPVDLDARTETLRDQANRLTAIFNTLRNFFLDRDGTTASEAEDATFMRGSLDMGLQKIVGMANGTDAEDAVTQEQLEAIQFDAEDNVEQQLNSRVMLLDGTSVMAAALNVGTLFRVVTMADGTALADLITKGQHDAFYGTSGSVPPTLLSVSGTPGMSGNLDMQDDVLQPGHDLVNVADATLFDELVNRRVMEAELATVQGEDVPVGTVIPYGGSDLANPPTNFLFCNGQEVSRLTYANLFQVIGVAYGSPSSGSVFKLPDLRGRAAAGLDNMGNEDSGRLSDYSQAKTLGGKFGAEDHALAISEIADHDHGFNDATFADGAAGALDGSAETRDADNTLATDTGLTTDPAGSGTAHANVQPALITGWLIRA